MHTRRKRLFIWFGIAVGLLASGLFIVPARTKPDASSLNRDAFVYVLNFGIHNTSIEHRSPMRNGFVIGDGQYILTAAHCADDFENSGDTLRQPLILSPYYGNVFEAKIVALDEDHDIAVLKPAWEKHPGLALESNDSLQAIEQITVAGYPPQNKKLGGDDDHLSLAIQLEKVPVVTSGGQGHKALCVGPVKYVGPGWSGSPLVNSQTGRVAGIACTKQNKRASLRVRFLGKVDIPFSRKSYIYGCDTAAIMALFEKHNLTYQPAANRPTEPGRRARFERIVRAVEVLDTGDIERARAAFEQLGADQPDCAFAYLMGGLLSRDGIAYFQQAIDLAPDSDFVCAGYGHYLFGLQKYRQSAELFEAITGRNPDHVFAWHCRLRALVQSDPNAAVQLGKQLIQRWPDNPDVWFELCKACRKQQHHTEELNAIETAIALCKQRPYLYQRYLADALGSNKRYADAQAAYRKLLAEHECARCWSAYTALLVMMGPDKQAQARAAFEKSRSADTDHSLSATWFEKYEQAIEAMSSNAGADPNHTAGTATLYP